MSLLKKSHLMTPIFALTLMLTFTTQALAACSTEPDAPDCPCFDDTGAWSPTGAYIQDIALDTLGTRESCPCPGTTGCNWEISPTEDFANAGKPYYQIVLGANSELAAWIMSWGLANLGQIYDHRQAWCSETISYWHREAGIPYADGYNNNTWYCDWQNRNVSALKTWYETEDYFSPMGSSGRGRWISYEELDYANFQLGVTVPVPGSYVAIRGYTLGRPPYWQGLSNSHSLMINEMWVHKDYFGNVFQIEVTLLEGNSGNRVRDDHTYEDLWSLTPAGPDWIGSDRKIYGFGVDLGIKRQPVYDASRLHYVHHQNIHLVPGLSMAIIDHDWDTIAQRIPQLRSYAQMIDEDGPKVTSSSPSVKVPGIPDSNNIRWYFPKELQGPVEILIDLMAVHPLPIRAVEITWDGGFIPRGYSVQYSSEEKKYQNAILPDMANVQFPQNMPSFPIPAYFSESTEGVAVRYVKITFPRDTFQNDATVVALRFNYDQGPWQDAEDNPPCKTDIPGDINKDCIVDFKDFAILAAHWLDQS